MVLRVFVLDARMDGLTDENQTDRQASKQAKDLQVSRSNIETVGAQRSEKPPSQDMPVII